MGIVKRNSITITILSYLGIVVGYVNKILLFPNFLSEEQVGLANILVSMAVMYAQFSAMGINSTIVKFFPFFRTPDRRHNGFFFWTALGVSLGFVLFTTLFLIFREPVTEYYAQKSPLLSKYYLLLIPLGFTTLFFNFFTAWLQALYKTVVSSFVYEVALRLLVTAEISLYALGAIDFEQFIVGYVLIYFVPTLVLLVYTLWTRRIDLRPVWTGRTRRAAVCRRSLRSLAVPRRHVDVHRAGYRPVDAGRHAGTRPAGRLLDDGLHGGRHADALPLDDQGRHAGRHEPVERARHGRHAPASRARCRSSI